MFSQPFVLRHIGGTGLFSNSAALDVFVSLLLIVGVGALAYGVSMLAKAPDRGPRVHLKPEHRRHKKRRPA